MERHRNHRFDLIQIDFDHSVIVSNCCRIQFLVISCSAVNLIELLHRIVRSPDRGKAGRLGCHDVHTDTIVHTHVGNTRSDELHDLIFHITAVKHFADDRQCNILRSDALARCTRQINADYARHINIVCLGEKLLYQLRTALADCHGTERSVSRVGIRSEDHLAACRQHLSGKLVNDCLMRRHIDSAIALCTGQPKHVVILVDGAAHCAETVVAVRQYIRNRELLQSRCTCCLYDSYERNVVGSQLIKLDLQLVHIAGYIVIL